MSDQNERLRSALADRYTLEREIGKGGMATVYLAHDVRHERDQAGFGYEPLVAYIHEALGAREEALVWLERAYDARAVFLTGIASEWMPLDSLRDDPRFMTLIEKLGIRVRMGGQ